MSDKVQACCYKSSKGKLCTQAAKDSGLCFWHDHHTSKENQPLSNELEDLARNHQCTQGLQLKRVNLENVNLVNHNHKTGFDLSDSDLYRANLRSSHLFNINLENSSLMKADLRDSNLHCANLKNCNLLGVKWQGAKIENLQIGTTILQEDLAENAIRNKDFSLAIDYYQQAEEIYRDLRKQAESEGIFSMAGDYIVKELTMRRMQHPKYSWKRITSKVVDMFCGYGEKPLRVVTFSIYMILFCAMLYFFTGISSNDQHISYSANLSLYQALDLFFTCLYYSVVTFTTLGYGDITPVGLSRGIAAIEAFLGSFTIALFVVVFVKKMTR